MSRVVNIRQRTRTLFGVWKPTKLAPPIHAGDNAVIARALSIIHDITDDRSPLPVQQARDIVEWYERGGKARWAIK